MDIPSWEVDYTSATTGTGVHEVHKGHVDGIGGGDKKELLKVPQFSCLYDFSLSYFLDEWSFRPIGSVFPAL
jgi:hypothetical protein